MNPHMIEEEMHGLLCNDTLLASNHDGQHKKIAYYSIESFWLLVVDSLLMESMLIDS